jgi:hypothetical protein
MHDPRQSARKATNRSIVRHTGNQIETVLMQLNVGNVRKQRGEQAYRSVSSEDR